MKITKTSTKCYNCKFLDLEGEIVQHLTDHISYPDYYSFLFCFMCYYPEHIIIVWKSGVFFMMLDVCHIFRHYIQLWHLA